MKHCKVSVILTSYNHEKYIKEAIDSVLDQTFEDFELIIVDDNSSDISWEIIQNYSDERIIAFQTERENSIVEGMIKSIQQIAKGKYIAIHHSDDVWEPTKLEKQVKFLDENDEYGAVFTHVKIIDEYNQPINNDWFNVSSGYNRFNFLNDAFNGYNKLCHPSVLIRKKNYDDLGCYSYGLAQTGDMEMWSKVALHSDIFIIPEKLTLHRKFTDKSNTSGSRPDVFARTKNEFFFVLNNFLKIQDFNILSKIFPEIKTFATKDKFVVEYCLGMMALKSVSEVTKIFGIELLYKVLNDEEKAFKIKRFYDFDYRKLIDISPEYDFIHSSALMQSKESELSQTKQSLQSKESELSQTKQSLQSKESELSQTKQSLQSKESELSQTKQSLQSKESELSQTKQSLQSKESELSQTKQSLQSKESELSQTKQSLQSKESELSQTKQNLQSKEQELSQTKQELNQTKQELENIKIELANIYISKSWKLTRPLRRFMRIIKK